MKRDPKKMPPINRRIWDLIERDYFGNVSNLASAMGHSGSQKLNRLFTEQSNGTYPTPTTDVIIAISNLTGLSTDYLLLGKDSDKHINNINIGGPSTVNGNNNITASKDVNSSNTQTGSDTTTALMEIIKMQQQQFAELTNILHKSNGNGN